MSENLNNTTNFLEAFKPLEVVGGLFSNIDLTKYKVHKPVSLFPLSPKEIAVALKEFKCPICMRKLYFNVDKSIARCKSKRADKFFVKAETLKKYT